MFCRNVLRSYSQTLTISLTLHMKIFIYKFAQEIYAVRDVLIARTISYCAGAPEAMLKWCCKNVYYWKWSRVARKNFWPFVSKTGVATATAVQYLMGSCLPHQHYTDWYDGRHISCYTSFPPPPPPIKKLNGSGRFRKVTLKGSGGVRTPGPPRPATGLKESWLFISI